MAKNNQNKAQPKEAPEATEATEAPEPTEPTAQTTADQAAPAEAAAVQPLENKDMPCVNCGDNAAPLPIGFNDIMAKAIKDETGNVRVHFIGNYQGPVTYFGEYEGCIDCPDVFANPNDVQKLVDTGVWAIAIPPEA
jgi:hypothetical protein